MGHVVLLMAAKGGPAPVLLVGPEAKENCNVCKLLCCHLFWPNKVDINCCFHIVLALSIVIDVPTEDI